MAELNEHVADLVDDYLHALLPPGRAAEVERHCADCPRCQAALEEARRRRALLQAVPPSEAPPSLIAATLRRIGDFEHKRRRRFARFFIGSLAALAAGALILIGAQIYYNRLSATPYDLLVLGQHNLLAAAPGSLRIRLTNRAARTALAGVPVVVELRGSGRSVELARFNTDVRGVGEPRFRLPDWPDGEYGLVITADTPGGAETVSRPVRLRRSWKLMLTSDKPVYQPGQTIHVRALALRQPDLRPVAEQEAVFALIDPKDNVLFKQSRRTSRFGIAATDCELAREILEGAYTLACKVGDSESRQRIEIRKYVLPKFKVDVQLDRAFYQPKETAALTVQADYFFGKPVADAAVEIEVRKGAPAGEVLRRFFIRTDERGTARAEYAIPDRPAEADDMKLSFVATVTDSAGQKQTRSAERIVTRQPVRVEVLPENGQLVRGVSNIVYLLATHADGKPARVRLQIGGLNQIVNTDANGVATCEVTPPASVESWTLVAWEAGDKEVLRRNVSVPCGPAVDDFLLRTDRGVYESGQTMRLTADGGGTEPVFVDLLKGEQTLLSETIAMTEGRGSCAFDLPLDLFGTVRLCAYRLDADGVTRSKTRVVYIHPAGQLKIAAKFDQKEYRPGGRAHLDLALTDVEGKPCPGALSLAGVDEAVFSVLPQRPGTETMFYTLDRQLLERVYRLHAWSPQRRAADGGLLEQALFAATVENGMARPEGGRGVSKSSSLHSLMAASLNDKSEEIERERAVGAGWIYRSWLGLLFLTLWLGYIALWCFLRPITVILLHFAALLLVLPMIGLFLITMSLKSGSPPGFAGAKSVNQSALAKMDEERPAASPGPVPEEAPPGARENHPAAPRVRQEFPETLLWTPQLITDDAGRARLDIELADSITTWRLSASAVAADGRLGATQFPLKVFQPFFVDLNLPVALTRNDEVSVPVVVYNYLDKPQTVALRLKVAPWFALEGDAEQRLELGSREVRSIMYRIRAAKVGTHELELSASAGDMADAVKRRIEVVPDGRRVEMVFNGTLGRAGGATLEVPRDAIEGSPQAFVKIYPSAFSEVVEGLDSIFRLPYGCFEQTSSTTYPNILALNYLRRTNRSAPQIEAKARHYIHLGYQRLLTFEVAGGGFEWFGHEPANRLLTAYGLMEFRDMARVHEVDPKLIERTRRWLLRQRQADGSWAPEYHLPPDGGEDGQARLAITAYVAWAIFAHAEDRGDSAPTREFLRGHAPDRIRDPYVLALVSNALLALDPQGESAIPYLNRLEALKQVGAEGKHFWWQQPAGATTLFHGAGTAGRIETTALAALALRNGQRHAGTVRGALSWLVAQKDAGGTWHSTQATVLALKALLSATDGPLGSGERRILVELGDRLRREMVIRPDQAEVLQQFDLSPFLTAGRQRLDVREETTLGGNYQVIFRYHVPETKGEVKDAPLTVRVEYDRTELRIGETIKATAKVANHRPETAAMVMLELPIPAGFTVEAGDFAALVRTGRIARFQVQGGKVLVYLRELGPRTPLELTYHLRATLAGKVRTTGARAYEYYNPEREGRSAGTRFNVAAQR